MNPLSQGVLLPEATVHTGWFAVLAAFVAINTVMYVVLAVAKTLPRVYVSDWVGSRVRRAESRSIHPEERADPGTD